MQKLTQLTPVSPRSGAKSERHMMNARMSMAQCASFFVCILSESQEQAHLRLALVRGRKRGEGRVQVALPTTDPLEIDTNLRNFKMQGGGPCPNRQLILTSPNIFTFNFNDSSKNVGQKTRHKEGGAFTKVRVNYKSIKSIRLFYWSFFYNFTNLRAPYFWRNRPLVALSELSELVCPLKGNKKHVCFDICAKATPFTQAYPLQTNHTA